jgi:hypothetical protein
MREKTINNDNQVKSKKRVADHGEVFTSEREVNAMLDLVKNETERIDSRFLEPACGNGNFLAEILNRKLNVVDLRYIRNQKEWEKYAIIGITSIYGVDIMEDNTIECRARLLKIFEQRYSANFSAKISLDCLKSVEYILNRNILWGNALDFTNPNTNEPIVFSEWTNVSGSMIKRRDYVFRFLVEKTHQFSLFNEEGQPAAIDEPVKDYPVLHFLKLAEYDTN